MAESYIITIKFAPSNASLKDAEGKLTKMFKRVTNGFKNGFNKVWKGMKVGAGVTAMATAITALLNPMSELNDRINQTLDKASGIKDRSEAVGTDVKSYLALQGYAKSKGVSEETLSGAIARMQSMVGAAKNGEQNALWEYRGETDMAKVFYNVMNQIAKVQDPAERAALASDVFGRNAVTALGPLVTEGFQKETFNKLLSGIDLNKVEKSVYKLDDRANEQAVLAFKRDMQDMVAKGNVINSGTIKAQDQNARAKLDLENKQIQSYADLASVDSTLTEIKAMLAQLTSILSPLASVIKTATEGLSMLPKAVSETKDLISMLYNRLPSWIRRA